MPSSNPFDDDADFFNPSLLRDDEETFDELDDRLAQKVRIADYDDDKNDETFGDEGFFIGNNDSVDLLSGNTVDNRTGLDDGWNQRGGTQPPFFNQTPMGGFTAHHPAPTSRSPTATGGNSIFGTNVIGGSSSGGISMGHQSPSSPSGNLYIPGTGSSVSFAGQHGQSPIGSLSSMLNSSPRGLPVSNTGSFPSSGLLQGLSSPSSGGLLSGLIGGQGTTHHHRNGSFGSGGSGLWSTSSTKETPNEDAFLGSFFGGTSHHSNTIGKSSTDLHFITDLITEEDDGPISQHSSGNSSPFGVLNESVTNPVYIGPSQRITLTGGLETLEHLPVIYHKHPELVKGEKPSSSTTSTSGTTTSTDKTNGTANGAQQNTTPSYLMVKYNTYNIEDRSDCYNVINKTVINDVLNKVSTPQEQRNRYHNRYHSKSFNNSNGSEKPHRIIQYMRIDEVETIVRQQMVDLQVHNGYSDDYYYFIHNNSTEDSIDLMNKYLSEEEEEREQQQQLATPTTPATRLFGRIPSQNVRTPRTCFDTNVFRDEVVEQYYRNRRSAIETRSRLIYNNPVQLRTCIENGLTLLIEISEFLTVHPHVKDVSAKVIESFNQNCKTVASYLQYQQEMWEIPKGKKFIYKALSVLPEPFITKLLIDMIPIMNADYHSNPTLLEAMKSACRSIVNIDAISMILMQLMQSPLTSIDFFSALIDRSLYVLSTPNQKVMSVHSWYQLFVQQFIPYFASFYHILSQSSPDAFYSLFSVVLKATPKNTPPFFHLMRALSTDPHNHPLKTQMIQIYSQPMPHHHIHNQ